MIQTGPPPPPPISQCVSTYHIIKAVDWFLEGVRLQRVKDDWLLPRLQAIHTRPVFALTRSGTWSGWSLTYQGHGLLRLGLKWMGTYFTLGKNGGQSWLQYFTRLFDKGRQTFRLVCIKPRRRTIQRVHGFKCTENLSCMKTVWKKEGQI